MIVNLDQAQLAYLRGKTRQDILNRRRQLGRARLAPGQDPAQFEDFKTMLRYGLNLRESVYRALGEDPRGIR